MAVIGCDIPVSSVVGAEVLGKPETKGVWTKTLFKQDGNYLTSTTYLVADGEPMVFSMRVDLRPLLKVATAVHKKLHEQMAPTVNGVVVGFSFGKAWRSIKKTAKKIGKSKLIKAVGSVVKTVAKSKLVGAIATGLSIAVPVVGVPALAAYASAHAATKAISAGKKLVHTAAKIQNTTKNAAKVASAVASLKQKNTAQAKAHVAAAQKLQAQHQSSPPAVKAQAHAQAQAHQTAAKTKARTALAASAKASPLIAQATRMKQAVSQPAVKAKMVAIQKKASSAATNLEDIKRKALYGTPEEKLQANKDAAIINLTAQNDKRIEALAQLHAGGLPALLIDKKGKIIRGRYRVSTTAPGKNPDVLYTGPKAITQSGAFTKISGLIGAADEPRICPPANVGAGHAPFPPLSPSEKKKREAVIHSWLASRGAALSSPEVGCSMILKTPPMPKVAPVVSGWTIGCDCEGKYF